MSTSTADNVEAGASEGSNFTAVNVKLEKNDQELPSSRSPSNGPKTPKKRKSTHADDDSKNATSPTSTKKSKVTPSKKGTPNKPSYAPTQPDDLVAEDRLIYDLVKDGKKWPEITKALEALDGIKRGASTARMRWQRFIEPSMSNVKDDDHEILMAAVAKIDEKIAADKRELDMKRFNMIVKEMAFQGTEVYPAKTVEKTYGQISSAKAVTKADSAVPEEVEEEDVKMEE